MKIQKWGLASLALGLCLSLGRAPMAAEIKLNPEGLREALLGKHRLLEKIVEERSEWESAFCPGVYYHRILLRTRISDLGITINDEGSIRLKARFAQPYVGFQGNYQGFYSLCFPVSGWSGLSAEDAQIEALIHFSEGPEGRVVLRIQVDSVRLGKLSTGALSPEMEKKLTELINQGMTKAWSSFLGEWFNSSISNLVNDHLPINL